MNFAPLEQIANAVLYEGFLLYPYRKSSVKNQHRWHFGTIEGNGGVMQTECLVEGDRRTAIAVKIRFLQGETSREIDLPPAALIGLKELRKFSFPPVEAEVEIASVSIAAQVFRLTVRIRNASNAAAGLCPMLSTHTLLAVEQGGFFSLIDPPQEYKTAAAGCQNIGTWPVLGGIEGQRALMLSSPVILYDYPQVAPESAGDLFDGTEIDEILSLRILTMSAAEKQEVREAGGTAQSILERTESLPAEALAKMHGAIRYLRNSAKLSFRAGDRVRLHPKKQADIFDIALRGKIAIVESVERDFENKIHLAVTVEDDPGRDLGTARYMGHRFFFGPDEVELV